jgi:hypothetical protein
MSLWRIACVSVLSVSVAGCGVAEPHVDPVPSTGPLRFAGEYVMPAATVAPVPRFGGISGLASLAGGRELLGIADDRERSRMYRFRVEGTPPHLTITTTATIELQPAPGAPAKLDPEGIAVTSDGRIFISSEGISGEEPRIPPSILEYSKTGGFIGQVAPRPRFLPTPVGPVTSGVRDNAAFESLTLTPDGRLFTAAELPLIQDGEAITFGPGSRTRLLEFRSSGGRFAPAREFAYDIEGIPQPSFVPTVAINGIVELLALGGDEFLSLERGYAESENRTGSLNRIRIFRISLADATDISGIDSLRAAGNIIPVRKTLLLDLNDVAGLSPALGALDNFEGMAWGPALPGGRPQLLLVSDDNYSRRQVTAFLSFAADPALRHR